MRSAPVSSRSPSPGTGWRSWRHRVVDYVASFFAAVHAGNIAVPLFAPTLAGHTERLTAVLGDARPAVVLTTTAAAESVRESLRTHPVAGRPRLIAVDAIPATLASMFTEPTVDTDDVAYLQYTSGSTRIPAGVEITHRAVCTNVLQMILGAGLDRDIRSVSWLPLYHDMGLIMIMFPALCGGEYLTLLDPMAFVRRPVPVDQGTECGSQQRPDICRRAEFRVRVDGRAGATPGRRHHRPAATSSACSTAPSR